MGMDRAAITSPRQSCVITPMPAKFGSLKTDASKFNLYWLAFGGRHCRRTWGSGRAGSRSWAARNSCKWLPDMAHKLARGWTGRPKCREFFLFQINQAVMAKISALCSSGTCKILKNKSQKSNGGEYHYFNTLWKVFFFYLEINHVKIKRSKLFNETFITKIKTKQTQCFYFLFKLY